MPKLFSHLMFTTPEEEVLLGNANPASVDGQEAVAAFLLFLLGLLMLSLVNYILYSIGLFRMAKNHGIDAPLLSILPVARQWVKGSIVDFHSEKQGYSSKWRIILPIFACLPMICIVIMYCALAIISIILFNLVFFDGMDANEISPLIIGLVFYVVSIVAMVINHISNIICDYKIFESINRKRAVLFTLLSYVLPLARGICFICCANECEGINDEPIAPETQKSTSEFDNLTTADNQPATVEPLQTLEYLVEDDVETVAEATEDTPTDATTEAPDDSDIFTE